jgi:hypothetical protein
MVVVNAKVTAGIGINLADGAVVTTLLLGHSPVVDEGDPDVVSEFGVLASFDVPTTPFVHVGGLPGTHSLGIVLTLDPIPSLLLSNFEFAVALVISTFLGLSSFRITVVPLSGRTRTTLAASRRPPISLPRISMKLFK